MCCQWSQQAYSRFSRSNKNGFFFGFEMWKVRFSQLQVVVIILKCCIATLRYLLFYSCEKQKAKSMTKLWIHFETLLDSNQFHVNSTQKPIGHSHKHCICISSRFFFYFYFYFDLKKKIKRYLFHL